MLDHCHSPSSQVPSSQAPEFLSSQGLKFQYCFFPWWMCRDQNLIEGDQRPSKYMKIEKPGVGRPFIAPEKTGLFQPKKNRRTMGKSKNFQEKKGRFQDFLFHFFLGVFTELLYRMDHLETRPRTPSKLISMRFIVTNYIHKWIDVKCRQNDQKTGIFPKRPSERACPFKSGRLLYTGYVCNVAKSPKLPYTREVCLKINLQEHLESKFWLPLY